MNEEKIKCLLLINESKKITVTALAKKMNVSKATMSRMINTFYEQGLTLDKGKCQLSKKGQEYIEKIQETFKKSSLEGKAKIYIIENIEYSTKEAMNTLLKMLEEPNEGIYALFTAKNINRVLPTIISRCQVFTSNKFY